MKQANVWHLSSNIGWYFAGVFQCAALLGKAPLLFLLMAFCVCWSVGSDLMATLTEKEAPCSSLRP